MVHQVLRDDFCSDSEFGGKNTSSYGPVMNALHYFESYSPTNCKIAHQRRKFLMNKPIAEFRGYKPCVSFNRHTTI